MKIGILSGTFDPIHNGHLALAKAAQKEAQLDEVYFLVEKKPRNKQKVTNYVQRKAMVEIALRGQKNIELLELSSQQFSVEQTLPELRERFEDAELYLIVGNDVCIDCWVGIDVLKKHVKFIVGSREGKEFVTKIPVLTLKTQLPNISSSQIRSNPAKAHELISPVVGKYIETQKLYDSESVPS